MATGLTGAAMTVREAAEPVLMALSRGDRYARAQVPDLLATVTEKVLRQVRDGRRIDDLSAYAKRTARNTFNDWLRSKGREPAPRQLDGDAEYLAALAGCVFTRSPSSVVIELDDQRRHAPAIRAALANLTGTERDVLRLRFAEGRSSAEVAELLGYKSPAVVDTIASRARTKLRDQLSPSIIDVVIG